MSTQTIQPANGAVAPAAATPEQIAAVARGQNAEHALENDGERAIVLRQLYVGVVLILGGAIIATLGIAFASEQDATKLAAIISLGTAVIGAGAAVLPTGAAAGAAARILARPGSNGTAA